jgi:hypothetical protein
MRNRVLRPRNGGRPCTRGRYCKPPPVALRAGGGDSWSTGGSAFPRERATRSEFTKKGRERMASSSKKKTTMAKLNREAAVRERRLEKQAKKNARKLAAAQPSDEASEDAQTGVGSTRDTSQSASPSIGAAK